MSMEKKHSPLPWTKHVSHYEDKDDTFVITTEFGKAVVVMSGKANAAFIVKACNSHYELVEALKEIASYPYSRGTKVTQADAIVMKALAALKKVELPADVLSVIEECWGYMSQRADIIDRVDDAGQSFPNEEMKLEHELSTILEKYDE